MYFIPFFQKFAHIYIYIYIYIYNSYRITISCDTIIISVLFLPRIHTVSWDILGDFGIHPATKNSFSCSPHKVSTIIVHYPPEFWQRSVDMLKCDLKPQAALRVVKKHIYYCITLKWRFAATASVSDFMKVNNCLFTWV